MDDKQVFLDTYDKYEQVFGEQFPTMELQHLPMSELTAVMQDCIKKQKPYISKVPDDCII